MPTKDCALTRFIPLKMEGTILIHLSIIIIHLQLVSSSCDRNDGPAGSPECVLLDPYYSKYQWATCLTNEYIQTVSKGNAICRDHSATYCYYQCMMESYEIPDGDVHNECACGIDAPKETQALLTNKTQLPSHCFSPSGKDCNWYRGCLERRFPCKQSQQTSYAINNGDKFCNLYEEHYKKFSIMGQQWIDAVRGCLQVALVPLLRPYFNISCNDIKQTAFDSHVECYTNPRKNAPSVCDLTMSDKFQIGFTVIPGLFVNCFQHWHLCKDIFASAYQLWKTLKTCYFSKNILSVANNVKQIQVVYYGSTGQSRYLTSAPITDDFSAGAELINKIANQMEWKSTGVSWIAYFQDKIKTDKKSVMQHLNILIAPSKLYNLNDNTNVSSLVNVTEAVEEVTDAFRNGTFTSDMINGISIVKYFVCVDNNCMNKFLEFEPLSSAMRKASKDKFWSLSNTILISGGSSLLLLIFLTAILCMRKRNSSNIV
ncbi:uncharacterized protein LOC134249092 [Saccostrea cucullata]|uniref:uncharacterized protein LOC134249092 n=1 Tax=Saccostrea cuccullata TaxID=36930 RepID=UPI002ED5D4FB